MAASMSEGNFENFIKILKENVVTIRDMCNKYKQNAPGIEEFVANSLEKLEKLDGILHLNDNTSETESNEVSEEENGKDDEETGETKSSASTANDDDDDDDDNGDDDQKKETSKANDVDCKQETTDCGKKTPKGCSEEKEEVQEIDNTTVDQILQLYSQVLLDVTFCEENILVDGIFPEKNAKFRVHKLLSMLRQPEVICQHCFPDKTAKEILGEEILECLLWRRGALLYMYCHTIQEDSARLEREHAHFIEDCKDGALYLKQMLHVRRPLQDDRDQVITNSEDVFALLKKGLFSDTHVLSLIYAGELCYWHIKHSKSDTESKDPGDEEFDNRKLGSSVLHLFLEVVQGPLKNLGWSTQRANQLLEYIEESEKQS